MTQDALDKQIQDNIKFFILPSSSVDGEEEGQREVEFDWQIKEIFDEFIDIQIIFDDPLNVSKGKDRDRLVIKIDMTGLDSTVQEPLLLETKIPKQVPLNAGTEALSTASTAAEGVTTAATVGSGLSQFLMSGALTQLWGMINGLQIFVHLPLFSIEVPANAMMLVEKLLTIATFDIIESEVAFGWLFEFPEEDEDLLKGDFGDSGYESAYTVNLLGTGFIFIAVVVVTMALLFLTWPLTKLFAKIR